MKVLLTLHENNIAPRFDLTAEVTIAEIKEDLLLAEPRCVLLPGPSGDELCSLILKENIEAVICGGIEDVHYQYLAWKKIRVIDRVIGPCDKALNLMLAGQLCAGAIIDTNKVLDGENP